ncbi:MAG: hypothetical protein WA653_23455, partial [Candidatus Sulfotelmatobacter sp.]
GIQVNERSRHFPLNAIAPRSWIPQESQVESCEYQDYSNIRYQPFPESVSEEREICTDYDGHHRHHVKHSTYLSAHFRYLPTSVYSPSHRCLSKIKQQPGCEHSKKLFSLAFVTNDQPEEIL